MNSKADPITGLKPFVVTNRAVLAIAVPMTLAYLTTPLLGLVDIAVVGQLGDAAMLGGLAAGTLIFDVVFTTFNFVRAGTTALVAQAFGRADTAEEQAVFWRACVVSILIGVVLAALASFIAYAGQWFIAAEPRVDEALATYVTLRLLGAPFALVNYAILGYVLGRGEGSLGLLLQIVLNGVNILLALYLGLHLRWGVAGVAMATIAGELTAMLLGFAILLRRFARSPRPSRGEVLDLSAFWRLMALNRDIMIRSFTLLAAFALFARQGAQFGTVTLAANAVLMNFFLLAAFFLDGFAAAAEQLVGRAVGAHNVHAFRTAVRLCTVWGFVLAGLASLVQLLFGQELIGIVTTAEDVRTAADAYLPWAALTPLTAVLAFQMDGVFIGAAWSRDLRNMMLLSLAIFVVCLVVLAEPFGNSGLWTALHVFLAARGLSLLAALGPRMRATFGTAI